VTWENKRIIANHIYNPMQSFVWKIKLMNGQVIKMNVNKEDPLQYGFALLYHNISPQLCVIEHQINNLLNPDQIYIDIGANQGMRSFLFLSEKRETYMFEPNTYLNNMNLDRCKLNNFDNYKIEQLCLSNKEDVSEFYFSNEHSMSSFNKSFAEVHGISKVQKVQTTTLDSYVEKNNLSTMHPLIKIDVEGHEMNVISGAENTIVNLKPTFIIEIIDKAYILELFEKFSLLQYSIFGLNFGNINIVTEIPNIEFLENYQASDYLFAFDTKVVDHFKRKN